MTETLTALLRSSHLCKLARGILYNAARPDSICQIGGTCGVASTQHKVFSKHPSVAADMVASAALKGEWTGRDGQTIKIRSRTSLPLAISRLDGSLSFAGQKQDHFVTVDDYRPAQDGKPAQIHLPNQWGPRYNGWMNLSDFYKATTNTPIKLDGKWKENQK